MKKVKEKVTQSCPILCNPMDYTVHGIVQARILEWVAFPFSSGSFQPKNRTRVSCITTNCGKSLKRWEYQTTWSASWEICMQVKKQQLRPDMEQPIGSKLGKEYIKAVYCHPAYLTYMQSTSWEMLGWMKHKLESRWQGEISITSGMQMTPPLWQKVKN